MEYDRGYADNILTLGVLKKEHAILISILLYAISILISLLIYLYLRNPLIPIFLILWAIFTWIYSDRVFFGKFFKRLKDDWRGEVITYSIAFPSYTLALYLIMDNNLQKGLAVAFPMLFFGLSALLLKDIKDITEDRNAGLRTLGVVFSPSLLLRGSSHFLILYYLSIFLLTFFGLFKLSTLILIVPFSLFFVKTYLHFRKKNWEIEEEDLCAIQVMSFTTFSSLLLWGLANFLG
jgi:1,4-dihydroxy-2-naphthoate octaprenyltransferase